MLFTLSLTPLCCAVLVFCCSGMWALREWKGVITMIGQALEQRRVQRTGLNARQTAAAGRRAFAIFGRYIGFHMWCETIRAIEAEEVCMHAACVCSTLQPSCACASALQCPSSLSDTLLFASVCVRACRRRRGASSSRWPYSASHQHSRISTATATTRHRAFG